VKTNRNFLSAADRVDLVAIAKDGLEENRVSRRANAVLLLDRGWSFAAVAEALFIDDSTIPSGSRNSRKAASRRSSCST